MNDLPVIPIVPNGKRYWVLPDTEEDTVLEVGQYKLSKTADTKTPPKQGRVIAVGDAIDDKWQHEDMPLLTACKYRRAQVVIFGSYAGVPHRWDGVDYIILAEQEILGALPMETD